MRPLSAEEDVWKYQIDFGDWPNPGIALDEVGGSWPPDKFWFRDDEIENPT